MNISPLLIKKQEFEKSMRGYNVEEVQAFLNKVSDDLEELLKNIDQLKIENEKLKHELDGFHLIEKKLQDNVLKSEETSFQAIESAKKESREIMKAAELKSEQMIHKAEVKVNELQNSVLKLRQEKDLIIARLRSIIGTQSNLLEGKVKDAGEEPKKPVKQTESEKLDINFDDIVDKLL
jgi:cell division initiation protein